MSLTGRFSALFLAALGAGAGDLLDVAVRLGAGLPGPPGARAARRGAGHPGGGGRDPSRRRGVGAAASGPCDLGQESGRRAAAMDGARRPRPTRRSLAEPGRLRSDLGRGLARPGAGPPGRLVDRRGAAWRVARRVAPARVRPVPRAPGSGAGRPTVRGRFPPSLVLIACALLDPTEATLATLGGLLAALSGGIWLASAAALPRALAAGPAAADADGRVGAGARRRRPRLVAGRGRDRRRARRPRPRLQRAAGPAARRLRAAAPVQRRRLAPVADAADGPDRPAPGRPAARAIGRGVPTRPDLGPGTGRAAREDRRGAAVPQPGRGRRRPARRRAGGAARWVAEHLAGRPAGRRADDRPPRRRDGARLWIRAHPPLLGQLLDNLLDNAAQARPSRGRAIVVETRRDGGEAVLAVEDRGPGIAPEDLPAHLRAVLPIGRRRGGGASPGSGWAWPSSVGSRRPAAARWRCRASPAAGRGSRSASRSSDARRARRDRPTRERPG